MRAINDTGAVRGDEAYFRSLFDAVPSPVLIVDAEVRILDYNVAGAALLGPDRSSQLLKRGGEALHCIHSYEDPEGCGHSEHCSDCVIRDTVGEVLRGGATFRRTAKMGIRNGPDGEVAEVDLLLTAAPFLGQGRTLVLLILEDITELVQLRRILPICAHCKKIRNDRNYWESVEGYLLKHANIEFSHSICEDCVKVHYKDVWGNGPPGRNCP
jgi:PAS domain-containing protein